MSLFDALFIPIFFFMLFLVIGVTYYTTDIFMGVWADFNSTMSPQAQNISQQFLDNNTFQLHVMDIIVVGVVFFMAFIALMYAAMINAHPAFILVILFMAAGIIYMWSMMEAGLDQIITLPEFAADFNPADMPYFYFIKENMYAFVAVLVGALIFALYYKGGVKEGMI